MPTLVCTATRRAGTLMSHPHRWRRTLKSHRHMALEMYKNIAYTVRCTLLLEFYFNQNSLAHHRRLSLVLLFLPRFPRTDARSCKNPWSRLCDISRRLRSSASFSRSSCSCASVGPEESSFSRKAASSSSTEEDDELDDDFFLFFVDCKDPSAACIAISSAASLSFSLFCFPSNTRCRISSSSSAEARLRMITVCNSSSALVRPVFDSGGRAARALAARTSSSHFFCAAGPSMPSQSLKSGSSETSFATFAHAFPCEKHPAQMHDYNIYVRSITGRIVIIPSRHGSLNTAHPPRPASPARAPSRSPRHSAVLDETTTVKITHLNTSHHYATHHGRTAPHWVRKQHHQAAHCDSLPQPKPQMAQGAD